MNHTYPVARHYRLDVPALRYHVALDDQELADGYETIRQEVGVERFDDATLEAAAAAAAAGPALPPDASIAGPMRL